MDFFRSCWSLANDSKHVRWVYPLLFAADAVLCGLIVWRIPYTEIDWRAYMQQVTLYIKGETDYANIYGDTGPLVYPAAHVYIYRCLHYLTDEGRDIATAQGIFIGLYLATLWLVMQCYYKAGAPPYIFPLLVLSKRMHSIFMLRLFNDGFAVFFLFLTIYLYQRRLWTFGTVLYSVGLGVKMSLLLALPAVGAILWQGVGMDRAVGQAMFLLQVQGLLGYPFLIGNYRSYLTRAFEFSRVFLFKWTVNWRFVGEETFLSSPFSSGLLALHASLLALYMSTRWLKPGNTSLIEIPGQLLGLMEPPSSRSRAQTTKKVTPDFVLTSMLSAVVLGCLCARSLHYQFYAYIAWSTPFLLWRSGFHPVGTYVVWALQEWAWNVYPSTPTSSAAVVGCLAFTAFASWYGTQNLAITKVKGGEKDHAE